MAAPWPCRWICRCRPPRLSRIRVPDGPTFTIATNASTVYQGIGNFSALAAGMIVNLDLMHQSDGSLLATRIEVDDPGATNVLAGPIGTVFGAQGRIVELGRTNE